MIRPHTLAGRMTDHTHRPQSMPSANRYYRTLLEWLTLITRPSQRAVLQAVGLQAARAKHRYCSRVTRVEHLSRDHPQRGTIRYRSVRT